MNGMGVMAFPLVSLLLQEVEYDRRSLSFSFSEKRFCFLVVKCSLMAQIRINVELNKF